jgi:hypothetical protein
LAQRERELEEREEALAEKEKLLEDRYFRALHFVRGAFILACWP